MTTLPPSLYACYFPFPKWPVFGSTPRSPIPDRYLTRLENDDQKLVAKKSPDRIEALKTGAGNEIRTRDPNLGKVVLYQLSYSRKRAAILSIRPDLSSRPVNEITQLFRVNYRPGRAQVNNHRYNGQNSGQVID